MNYQPICDNPVDGRMSNGAGYRLCCNPKHQEESSYATLGPVWHKMSEWPSSNRQAVNKVTRQCCSSTDNDVHDSECPVGRRIAHFEKSKQKDYELITGVFQVHSQRSGGEVLCVPQRCKLYSNLSRGAAIPKIVSAVAGRYGVDTSQVKFWFWATGVSIPGNDVLCQFENDQVVTAKY